MPHHFQGRLIRLRAVEATDWEIHYRWNADDEMSGMVDEVWFPSSRDAVRTWAESASKETPKDDNFSFQIERLDGELVGNLTTHHCNLRNGTFKYGITVLPEHQRMGYASEAIGLVLRYYFRERRYQKVTIETYSFNTASIKLHEHLGFTPEGHLRRMVYSQGKFFDMLVYGMTREEFEAKNWLTD